MRACLFRTEVGAEGDSRSVPICAYWRSFGKPQSAVWTNLEHFPARLASCSHCRACDAGGHAGHGAAGFACREGSCSGASCESRVLEN